MYFRPARTLFGLVAVGGAVAVGIITRDAGFTALTFIGGLMLPRVLGVHGHHRHGGPWAGRGDHAHGRFEQRAQAWHRQAHGDAAPAPPVTSATGA